MTDPKFLAPDLKEIAAYSSERLLLGDVFALGATMVRTYCRNSELVP
jgi:hypothetical protein